MGFFFKRGSKIGSAIRKTKRPITEKPIISTVAILYIVITKKITRSITKSKIIKTKTRITETVMITLRLLPSSTVPVLLFCYQEMNT